DWSLSKISPLSFLAFFRQSKALRALAILSALRELPMYLNIDAVYRRQKFATWGSEQESTLMVLYQVAGFLSTFLRTRLMETLGLEGCIRLDGWISALVNLINAAAFQPGMLQVTPLLGMLQCGGSAVDRCLQQEAALLGAGSGALGAASANRSFVPSLVMPHIFTALYSHCSARFPSAPYAAAGTMSLLAAEVVVPWAFKQLN
ncbi:unnamed protein product, partial [Polarella glacialis]